MNSFSLAWCSMLSAQRSKWLLGILALGLLGLSLGCSRSRSQTEGILAGAKLSSSSGVSGATELNDGVAPTEGAAWKSRRVAVFSGVGAYVVWDLGAVKSFQWAALQGDNNDTYRVSVSSDGRQFQPVWDAGPTGSSGLRWRIGRGLKAEGRFIKLSSADGDSGMSVGELVLSPEDRGARLPAVKEVSGLGAEYEYRNRLMVFASILILLVLVLQRTLPNWVLGALGVGLLPVAWQLWQGVRLAFPFEPAEVSFTRGVAAILAIAVLWREGMGPWRKESHRGFNLGVLAFAALLALGSFFNLGRPQFYDAKHGEPSWVHTYDLRVYFPAAKYFKELKYDGVYLGSVAAYAEERGGMNARELHAIEMRDLRDHRMRRADELEPMIARIHTRFTPARWQEFKQDMRYFWETMGPRHYLGSLNDHGGNATPVWLTIAHALFKNAPATTPVLLWAALLDPALLLLFAVCAWRAFGGRTALLCLILYGANDFYMFGSNWGGATLRNDWMVYLGLGVCALKVERYRLGGVLLAMSALIRAFPAISLLFLLVPLLTDFLVSSHSLNPKQLGAYLKEQKWFLELSLGAVLCVAVSVLLSSVVLGFDAWPLWVKKISSFTSSPHVNHVSLLSVVAGSENTQPLMVKGRWPALALGMLAYILLTIWVARGRSRHQLPLLGMVLMPVLMYPANYYIHFIFLLPLAVDEALTTELAEQAKSRAAAVLALLFVCAAQYMTVKDHSLESHFYNASVILMAGLLFYLWPLLPRDAQGELLPPWYGFKLRRFAGTVGAAGDLGAPPVPEEARGPVAQASGDSGAAPG